jgi:hypothetical protein
MKSFVPLTYSLAILQTLVAGTVIPRYFQAAPVTRRNLLTTLVQQELGPLLSNITIIFGPDDSRYDDATVRWNILADPRVQLVIEAGVEADIATIVSIKRIIITENFGLQ